MNSPNLNRRDFSKMTAAALGGLVAGSNMTSNLLAADAEGEKKKELHVCRGLNTCKATGVYEKTACGGLGYCATVAYHDCAGKNACKGHGGCHGKWGTNECKGKGGCAVPLKDKAWKGARAAFEKKMKAAGTEVGAAPASKETPQGNEELRAAEAKRRASSKKD